MPIPPWRAGSLIFGVCKVPDSEEECLYLFLALTVSPERASALASCSRAIASMGSPSAMPGQSTIFWNSLAAFAG